MSEENTTQANQEQETPQANVEENNENKTEAPEINLQQVYGKAQKDAYDNIDKALAELGFEKTPNEKTSDFVKRVMSAQKETPEDTKVDDGADIYKAQIEALKAEQEKLNAQLQDSLQDKARFLQDLELTQALSSLDLYVPAGLEKAQKESYENMIKDNLKAYAKTLPSKEFEGKTYYINERGETMINPKTGEPQTLNDIIKNTHSHLIRPPKSARANAQKVELTQTNAQPVATTNQEVYSIIDAQYPDLQRNSVAWSRKVLEIKAANGIK